MVTNNIDIIVPVYNMLAKDVPVIQAADSSAVNCIVHICDNSENDEIKRSNALFCADTPHIEYHDMGGNIGLSKAYNSALNRCSSSVVCIFDDDTDVDPTYFQIVVDQVEKHGSGIFIPLVYNGDNLLSPLNSFGPAIFRYRDISNFSPDTCFAFNTGMAVTRDVFNSVRYDERLFIEWIDHAFCRDAHNAGINFYLMPTVRLEQDYSRESNSLESALHREKLAGPDLRIYYSNSIVDRMYRFVYRFYRILRSCLKYHSFAFFDLF